MARKPQVRYWQRKGGGFFCTLNGVQHELQLGKDDSHEDGPNYRAALTKYAALIAMRANVGTELYTVAALCTRYQEHLDRSEDKRRLQNFKSYVRSFAALHGKLPVAALAPRFITEWLDSQTQWANSSKVTAALFLQAALNWGVREGYIPSNPLKGRLKLPESKARGAEYLMPPELCRLLIRCAPDDDTRLVVRALHATAARPIELFRATGANLKGGMIVHPWNPPTGAYRWKNARKTKKDRVICLPPALAEELRALNRGPDDSLFQYRAKGRYGAWDDTTWLKKWNQIRAHEDVVAWLKRDRRPASKVIPYGFRHTWLSEWVASGRSVHIAADLCGTSVAMIERHYNHPDLAKMYSFYKEFMGDHQISIRDEP